MDSGTGRNDKAHFRAIAAARAVTCVRGFAYVGQSMEFDGVLLRPDHSVGALFAALLESRLDGGGLEEKGTGTRGAKRIGRDFKIVLLKIRQRLAVSAHGRVWASTPSMPGVDNMSRGSSTCRGLVDMSRIPGYVDGSSLRRGFLDTSRSPRHVGDSWICR